MYKMFMRKAYVPYESWFCGGYRHWNICADGWVKCNDLGEGSESDWDYERWGEMEDNDRLMADPDFSNRESNCQPDTSDQCTNTYEFGEIPF